jgi:hypothetical protein
VFTLLLVGVDRIAVRVAQGEAAKLFQSSQGLDRKPSIRIAGFPFLTQVAAGKFGQVTVNAAGLTVGDSDRTLRIASLNARLTGVHTSRNFSSARADSATAEADISYPDLSASLGMPIEYADSTDGRGRVKATRSVTVAGRQFSGTVSAEITVSGRNTLSFVSPKVAVGIANVPQAITDALVAVFARPLSLSGLPNGLNLQSVTASPDGLTVALSGERLTFTRSGVAGTP